jgi:hypothetical protein
MATRDQLSSEADELLAALRARGLVVKGQPGHSAVPPEADVELVQPQAADALARKGVIGVGFNPLRGDIVIYTNAPLTKREKELVPQTVPSGTPIRVEASKLPTVDARPPSPFDNRPVYTLRSGRYCCGSSISVGNSREAGTLGCLLRDPAGRLYGLTNNHVVGGCSYARSGLPIVAPGIIDVAAGGADPFTLGHFARVAPMVSGDPQAIDYSVNSDAALLAIADESKVSSWQGEAYDTPTQVLDIDGMAAENLTQDKIVFEKVGRTTGHTIGILDSETRGPERVAYKLSAWHSASEGEDIQMSIAYAGVIRIKGKHGVTFSQPGDSGSLVTVRNLETRKRYAFGLIFAGVANAHSYVLPIQPILDTFGVTLVGDLGT